MQSALHALVERETEIVVHVVEAELVVGAVGDVGLVGLALLVVIHRAQHDADAQTEEVIDMPHPFGIALGEVIVDRDDVHALAGQRVQIRRQRRDQGLALAGAHLGDLVVVENHAADELHVVVAQPERAHRGLAHDGESLVENPVEGFAVAEPAPEFVGLGLEVGIAQRLHLRLELVDALHPLTQFPDDAVVATAEQGFTNFGQHRATELNEQLPEVVIS